MIGTQMIIHNYISTACEHGLHEQCRITCKFCNASCLCPCHGLTAGVNSKLDLILTQIGAIAAQETTEMAEIDDLKSAVGKLATDVDTDLAEAQAQVVDLQAQLAAAIAAGTASAADLTAMKATATDLTNQLSAIDAKVTAAAAATGVTLPPAVPPTA